MEGLSDHFDRQNQFFSKKIEKNSEKKEGEKKIYFHN